MTKYKKKGIIHIDGGENYGSEKSSEKDNREKRSREKRNQSKKSKEEVRQLSVCARHCRLALPAQTDMSPQSLTPYSQSPIQTQLSYPVTVTARREEVTINA